MKKIACIFLTCTTSFIIAGGNYVPGKEVFENMVHGPAKAWKEITKGPYNQDFVEGLIVSSAGCFGMHGLSRTFDLLVKKEPFRAPRIPFLGISAAAALGYSFYHKALFDRTVANNDATSWKIFVDANTAYEHQKAIWDGVGTAGMLLALREASKPRTFSTLGFALLATNAYYIAQKNHDKKPINIVKNSISEVKNGIKEWWDDFKK